MLNNNMNLNYIGGMNVENMLNNKINRDLIYAHKNQYKDITKNVKEVVVEDNNKIKNVANKVNKVANVYGKAEVKGCGIVTAAAGIGTAVYGAVKEGLVVGALAGTIMTAAVGTAVAPLAIEGAVVIAATKAIDKKLNK